MSKIVNPLTDKEISASGDVAKKLYKMHIDKKIKLTPKILPYSRRTSLNKRVVQQTAIQMCCLAPMICQMM